MIKQIEITAVHDLESELEKARHEDCTHFVLINDSIDIYQPMLEAVSLKPCTIVADYTVKNQYINDCTYFGKSDITFNDWIENINHFPNVIYHIETTQSILNNYDINNIFDLALISLMQDDVITDSHVVFNFNSEFITSRRIWHDIKNLTPLNTTKFNLNKLAYTHNHPLPFKNNEILAPDRKCVLLTNV